LLVASVGVAFADVLADALIVEQGKPLRSTGLLQSVAWGSASVATLLTGYLGGYLSARGEYRTGFRVCGWSAVVVLAASVLMREPRRARGPGAVGLHRRVTELWAEMRSRDFLSVGAFLVLGNLGHFAEGVLYPYMVGALRLGEEFYGVTVTVSTFGSIAACLVYYRYCRRVPMSTLVNMSIASACASGLVYLALAGRGSALVVAAAAGFATMTAELIWFDLASRACAPSSAATSFALLMAAVNLADGAATWVGGDLYKLFAAWGERTALNLLLVLGAVVTACCRLLVPLLPRALLVAGPDDGAGQSA
jgi:predicted MFS family arabinose efflux permease